MQGTPGSPTSVAGPTPACLAAIRASNVVLALWLLYRAYQSLSGLSVETLHTVLPQAATCLLVAVLVLQRTVPIALRYDAMSVIAVVVSNGHYLLIDFSPSSSAAPSVVGTVLLVGAVEAGREEEDGRPRARGRRRRDAQPLAARLGLGVARRAGQHALRERARRERDVGHVAPCGARSHRAAPGRDGHRGAVQE